MSKFLKLLALVAIVAAAVVGVPKNRTIQAQDAEWARQPMDELTTVVVSVNAGSNEAALLKFADQIREELNIDLQVIGLAFEEQYALQLIDMQAAHQHDLYVFWPTYMADYAPFLKSLEEIAPGGAEQVAADMNFADVHPAYEWAWKFNGAFYSVQIDGDVKLLHYRADITEDPANKEAFAAEYGYEYDIQNLTWEQYLDVATFFSQDGDEVYGTAEVADFLTGFFWKDRLVGMGGHLFDYENMEPCYPNREVCERAFQNGIDTFANGSTPEGRSNGFDDVRNQFQNEARVVLHTMWPEGWRLANSPNEATGSNVTCNVDVALMPGFENAEGEIVHRVEMAGGRVVAVADASPEDVQQAAYKVLAFLSRPENARQLIVSNDTLLDPWTISDMQPEVFDYVVEPGGCTEKAQQYSDTLLASTVAGYPAIQIPGAGIYFEIYDRISREAFTGQISAEEATDKLIEEFNAATDDLGREDQIAAYQAYVDNVLKPLGLWDE
jgi:multiple sugar transport system substrate-binding protein